jgi:hypothetical protein
MRRQDPYAGVVGRAVVTPAARQAARTYVNNIISDYFSNKRMCFEMLLRINSRWGHSTGISSRVPRIELGDEPAKEQGALDTGIWDQVKVEPARRRGKISHLKR